MSNKEDKLVILSIGYVKLLVPCDSAMAFMKHIVGEPVCRFESKWQSDAKKFLECIEPVSITIGHLSPERYAIAKLTTEALKTKEAES
jgi:hypothetical protein